MNSGVEPTQESAASPLKIIAKICLIWAAALIAGFAIPALIAVRSGVFYMEDLERRIPQDVVNRLKEFNRHEQEIKSQINRISQILTDSSIAAPPDVRSNLLALRSSYERDLRTAKPPVSIQPFYQHVIMYFWPVMYTCSGCIIFLLRPESSRLTRSFPRRGATVLLTVGIFIFDVWPLWARNFSLTRPEHGRIVYAYSNYDVDPASFVIQQLNFFVFSLLLALIWQQWAAFYVLEQSRENFAPLQNNVGVLFDPAKLKRVSESLLRWQATFVVLSIGFIIYTAIFWNQIIKNGDFRFIFEAITVHMLWIVSAVLTALPLLLEWRSWQSYKLRAIWELINAPPSESEGLDARLTAIRELRPIGSWNAAASGLTVVTSFALPIIQTLIK